MVGRKDSKFHPQEVLCFEHALTGRLKTVREPDSFQYVFTPFYTSCPENFRLSASENLHA
jgi:hypothetical protein